MSPTPAMSHDWTYDEWEDEDGTQHSTDLYCAICYFEWELGVDEGDLPPCPVDP